MVIMNNANTTERLIQEVRSRPPLWDQRNLNYHNRVVVNALWQDIADLLQVNKETVKVKWKGLRDTYRRELKKQRSSVNVHNGVSSENTRDPSWTHYSSMNFLREYMGSNNNQHDLFHFQGWPTDDMVADEEAESPNATNEASFRPFAAGAEEQNSVVKPSSSTSPAPSLSGDDLSRDIKTELPSPDTRGETIAESSSSSPPPPPPTISADRREPSNHPKKRPITRFARLRDHRLRARLQKGKQQQQQQQQSHPQTSRSFPHQNGYVPIDDSDDDLYFFKSLIPYVKNLPPTRKLYLRSEIHNLVLREIMADTSNSSSSHHHTVIPLEHVTVGFNA